MVRPNGPRPQELALNCETKTVWLLSPACKLSFKFSNSDLSTICATVETARAMLSFEGFTRSFRSPAVQLHSHGKSSNRIKDENYILVHIHHEGPAPTHVRSIQAPAVRTCHGHPSCLTGNLEQPKRNAQDPTGTFHQRRHALLVCEKFCSGADQSPSLRSADAKFYICLGQLDSDKYSLRSDPQPFFAVGLWTVLFLGICE